ncbi:unnamed protein product [Darwinula stevensoni]|uniref:protein-tyrosine-phosphatase n=1 Tax=Darwinula stevensoni TaxID=69355 RepID=A0A7R8XBS1_9CRUS|nr:unnamed protein product [Darwinula stevensoni]CAG0893051.1 unnamed protein product [Darwinula stevensoni]
MAVKFTIGADVVIQIPWEVGQQDGFYRLDYSPPQGRPTANKTFYPPEIANGIELTHALPGTKYDFRLYYSNDTISDFLTWTASITTGVMYHLPISDEMKVILVPLSEPQNSVKSIAVDSDSSPFTLRNLTPGASYEVQLYTVYANKESAVYVSANLTTCIEDIISHPFFAVPNTPGRFIVWFRNETTLLVLWQPPYPPGIYSHYKVSIDPPDAIESILFVEKEGEPPGPAQAAFYGLVPGRAYNISVQTVSENQVSLATTAQYRTVPLPPRNVTAVRPTLGTDSFQITWNLPNGVTEYDRFTVALGLRRHTFHAVDKDKPRIVTFSNNLDPGHTYTVVVKTVSGNVASWPATGNVTTRPLPVANLEAQQDHETGSIVILWKTDPISVQDSFKVTWQEVGSFNGDSGSDIVTDTSFSLEKLLRGRNYSIAVQAISNGMESEERVIFQVTNPSSPIIETLSPLPHGLNISWKWDVTSRQDSYAVVYTRNDTGEQVTEKTEEPRITLDGLYPGAGYSIKVYAISNGLWSEPHVYFQAVCELKYSIEIQSIQQMTANIRENLKVLGSKNESSVKLEWDPPLDSIYDGFIIRYHTSQSPQWEELPPVPATSTSKFLTDIPPGQSFTFQLNSVSHRVESQSSLHADYTLRPDGIGEVTPLRSSGNITFEWEIPKGKVEVYLISWEPRGEDDEPTRGIQGEEEIPADEVVHPAEGVVRVTVDHLFPGQEYRFSFQTKSHGLLSRVLTLTTRTMPLIKSEVYLANNPEDTASLTVRFTPTPNTVSLLDNYRFQLSDPRIPVQEKSESDPDRKVLFHDLVPGRLYNLTCWTVSGGVTSAPLVRQTRQFPEPVSWVNASHVADTYIILTWNVPNGDHDAYEVQYLTAEDALLRNISLVNRITLGGLRPHRNYTFTVTVLSGSDTPTQKRSLPVSATFVTQESVPGKVLNFHPIDVTPSKITFEWHIPSSNQNGILIGFTIRYGAKGSEYTLVQDFGPQEFQGTIFNLIPGEVYEFQIQAKTQIGYGSVAFWEQRMPVWAPPRPNPQVFPTEVSRTSTTIEIRFRKNYFSTRHGDITAYAIIVAEDVSGEVLGLDLPTWQDVQRYTIWPPYQANAPYYPFNTSSVVDYTIGTEECHGKVGHCNGPLKPGSTYRVKIRAFTSQEKYSDTYWSHPIETERNTSGMVISIIIPLLLVIVLIVTLMLMRRYRVGICWRRKGVDKGHHHRGAGKEDNISLPDSVIVTSRPVKLKDFQEHYRLMAADSDFRFSEEYEELKHVGRDQPCTAADIPCNRPKNRFTNILPYDHSRFKLQPTDDEEGSDYINANYVPVSNGKIFCRGFLHMANFQNSRVLSFQGHNSPREFIVTQGPLHSTRDDLWRMIWEGNSRAIVMLTRCIEKGREKCDHYWPYDTQPAYYGDIQVIVLNESQYPDWTIREFKVTRGDTSRIVRHFHFTTWPDFGVPDPPQTLVRFVRAFRERVGPEQKPIVVHCSAGVGRSGTFIALDRILQHIKKEDYVDIFGMVYEMRRERVWMVQTEQQYICIHQCLLAVLEGRENDIPPREVHENEGFEDEGIAESGM